MPSHTVYQLYNLVVLGYPNGKAPKKKKAPANRAATGGAAASKRAAGGGGGQRRNSKQNGHETDRIRALEAQLASLEGQSGDKDNDGESCKSEFGTLLIPYAQMTTARSPIRRKTATKTKQRRQHARYRLSRHSSNHRMDMHYDKIRFTHFPNFVWEAHCRGGRARPAYIVKTTSGVAKIVRNKEVKRVCMWLCYSS